MWCCVAVAAAAAATKNEDIEKFRAFPDGMNTEKIVKIKKYANHVRCACVCV